MVDLLLPGHSICALGSTGLPGHGRPARCRTGWRVSPINLDDIAKLIRCYYYIIGAYEKASRVPAPSATSDHRMAPERRLTSSGYLAGLNGVNAVKPGRPDRGRKLPDRIGEDSRPKNPRQALRGLAVFTVSPRPGSAARSGDQIGQSSWSAPADERPSRPACISNATF